MGEQSVKKRSTAARLVAIGGISALGFLGVFAGGADAQSPSQSPTSTTAPGSTTTTTRVVQVTTATTARAGTGLARTGVDAGLVALLGGGGAAIALGARRLARQAV